MSIIRTSGWIFVGAVLVLAGCSQADRFPSPYIIDATPQPPRTLSPEQAVRMSEFLAQWSRSIGADYRRPANAGDCAPVVDVLLFKGAMFNFKSIKSCGPALDDALIAAIQAAGRPNMPVGLAGRLEDRWIGFRFYDRSAKANVPPVEVALLPEAPPAVQQQDSAALKPASPPPPINPAEAGIYSAFLHQWACNVSALYNPVIPSDGKCLPVANVELVAGEVRAVAMVKSCGTASDNAFNAAVRQAPRPPMPTSWAEQQVTVMFYATGSSGTASGDASCGKSPRR